MKNVRALIIVSLAVILTFIIIGCSASPQSLLLGKWEEVKDKKRGNPDVFEFLKDGTLLIGHGNEHVSTKYRVIDKARMELEIPGAFGGAGKIVAEYAVSQDALTMDVKGQKQKFTRIKS